MNKTISAVVRVRDSERTLAECLRSLKAQTRPPDEIVVVDNSSKDGTLEIARAHGCRLVAYPPEEPFSYGRALNLGIQHATGDFLLLFSSHNSFASRDALEQMTRLLSEQDACGAYCVHLWSAAKRPQSDPFPPVEWEAVDERRYTGFNGLANSCALVPRSAWLDHQFDENLPTAEDQEFALWHYRNRGKKTICLKNRYCVHQNPYSSDAKLIREIVVVATHFYPPWRSPQKILRHCAGGFLSLILLRFAKGRLQFRLAYHLTRSWFFPVRYTSKYF